MKKSAALLFLVLAGCGHEAEKVAKVPPSAPGLSTAVPTATVAPTASAPTEKVKLAPVVPASPGNPPAPVVVGSSGCGCLSAAECKWMRDATDIMDSTTKTTPHPNVSAFDQYAQIDATVDQARADLAAIQPPPARLVKANSYVREFLFQWGMMAKTGKIAVELKSVESAKSSEDYQKRAANSAGLAAESFQTLYNGPC